jgi:RNA polymerase sigma factor (sigma-70 family)
MSTIEFNQQILSFRKPLEFFAFSLTHDREDAADLVQDTYMKAVAYKDKFRDATNLKAWMYTIMKNTFINNYRRQVKSKTFLDRSDDLHYVMQAPDHKERHPASIYQANELERSVDDLQEEYRIPFKMHHDGYKYKEIADYLKLPIGTVKSRIFLARKKLMDVLIDYNPN